MEQTITLKATDWVEGAYDIQSRLAKKTFPEWFSETLWYALSLKYAIAGSEQGVTLECDEFKTSYKNVEENFLTNLRRLLSIFAQNNSEYVIVTVEKGECVKARPINVKVKKIDFIPKETGTDDV